jgi:hypothetical protein
VWRGGQKEKHEKKGPARGLPQGRYQKRELNKNVRGYSAKDLGAILGVAVPGGDAWGALAAAQEESVRNTHSRIEWFAGGVGAKHTFTNRTGGAGRGYPLGVFSFRYNAQLAAQLAAPISDAPPNWACGLTEPQVRWPSHIS